MEAESPRQFELDPFIDNSAPSNYLNDQFAQMNGAKRAKSGRDNRILKPQGKLFKNFDVTTAIPRDQLEFENIELEEDIDLPEHQPVPFERFGRKKENQDNDNSNSHRIVAEENGQNLVQIPEDEEIELEIVEEAPKTTSIIDQTLSFKKGFHLMVSSEVKKTLPTIDKIRTKKDLVKILIDGQMGVEHVTKIDPSELRAMMTVKTFEQMAEEKRQKELEKEKEEEDYNPSESEDLGEEFDPDQPEGGENPDEKKEEGEVAQSEAVNAGIEKVSLQINTDEIPNETKENQELFEANREEKNEKSERENEHENQEEEVKTSAPITSRRLKNVKEWRGVREAEKAAKKEEKIKELRKLRKALGKEYLEEEAELGSDNELNDGVVKRIDRKAVDEQELSDGSVSDTELVEKAPINLVEEDEMAAHQEFLKDLLEDEERRIREIQESRILRRNQAISAEELEARQKSKANNEHHESEEEPTKAVELNEARELFGLAAPETENRLDEDANFIGPFVGDRPVGSVLKPKTLGLPSAFSAVTSDCTIGKVTGRPNGFGARFKPPSQN